MRDGRARQANRPRLHKPSPEAEKPGLSSPEVLETSQQSNAVAVPLAPNSPIHHYVLGSGRDHRPVLPVEGGVLKHQYELAVARRHHLPLPAPAVHVRRLPPQSSPPGGSALQAFQRGSRQDFQGTARSQKVPVPRTTRARTDRQPTEPNIPFLVASRCSSGSSKTPAQSRQAQASWDFLL